MSIEDYYKTLGLKPNAGQVIIAVHYLKLVNSNYSIIEMNGNKEDFYRINRAIEVLRNEAIRKYYDIIYNEKENNTLDQNNLTIKKYLKVINKAVTLANKKSDMLLANSEYRSLSGKIQNTTTFWLKYLVYAIPQQTLKYISLPILTLVYLFFGLTLIFKQIEIFDRDYLIIGVMVSLSSIVFLYLSFVSYIFNKINK
ncbi:MULTISPECIES: hypothetical protein [unclassified Lentimicrobium]|uniref:hypothetical protein n=1 Tax=unclassified Lentimicrobium TaxID=2677434 RepID=UPI001554868A|nr:MULTISPECIES: hypothetical protein [unclassified Lentimicrobium]NPD45850.1 hypothetical protein [Lentimicrobium sp. S6]NPD86563.1 hypothetical protein [Lentimicrobium sp. L6]